MAERNVGREGGREGEREGGREGERERKQGKFLSVVYFQNLGSYLLFSSLSLHRLNLTNSNFSSFIVIVISI